jgi:hypothetical protein
MGAALIALAVCVAAPASAQEVAPPPTPNADRLAEEMRTLARDPRNVRALLSAGEMSARLNDAAAAAGFFARAQALDPSNPRVLAGQAMVMVRMERPGEALRLFAEAERNGLSMEGYASDRGLAYDLLGAQGHAQRDYRTAMRGAADDETIRRYALSLGISGQTDQAMRLLDPLLRRSDRAGWRARAFILAMNGDAAGADKIAASMMGGVGTALAPFFRRLPTLSASDKAFAVHFGELRRTAARVADAQLAPPLARLGQEPGVAIAAAEVPRREPQADPGLADRRSARPRSSGVREPLGWRSNDQTEARLVREREAKRLADLKAQQEREALAAKQREVERVAAEQQAAREAEARRIAEAQARERAATELAAREAETKRLAEAQRLAEARRLAEAQRQTAEPAAPAAEPVAVATAATPAASEAPPVRMAETAPPSPRIGGEDNVIARIIAGITIPASELGVEPMPGRAEPEPAVTTPPPAPVEVAKAETPAPRPAVERPKPEPVKPKPEPVKPKPEPVKPRTETPKPESAKPETGKPVRGKPADPKAAAAKPGDPKAAPKGKAAAKEKAKPDPAKTDPVRHWVQVAGGANVSDLPKAWRALLAKAPAELKGRQPWTTPLRFTNRLLVGPFKTPAEAQAFVNMIGKKGLSAFAWSSEAGQKIEKLAAK